MKFFKKLSTLFVGLTMALGVGLASSPKNVEEVKAAQGDQIVAWNTTSYSTGYALNKTATIGGISWVMTMGQQGFFGANSVANHTAAVMNGNNLNVAKADNPSFTATGTGYYAVIPQSALSKVGKITFTYSGTSGNNSSTAIFIVKSSALNEVYEKIELTSGTQGQLVPAGTYTYEFETIESAYYAILFKTSSYARFTSPVITFYEGAPITSGKTNEELAGEFLADLAQLEGNVTIESGSAIAAIEANYGNLSVAVKDLVDAADYAARIAQIITSYNNAIAEANQGAANIVIGMISALPETITLIDSDQIAAARTAYDALSTIQKDLVTNYAVLLAAEARIAELDPSASAIVVYEKNTKNLTWNHTSYATAPHTLTDSATLSGKNLTWLQNAGQLNGGIAYLGANSTNASTMNIDGADFMTAKPALAAVPDTSARVAMLRMGNFYINEPTDVEVSWTSLGNTPKVYLAASTDMGSTWNILKNYGTATANQTMTWHGLDYIDVNGVMFAVIMTSSADSSLRDVGIKVKALGAVTTEYTSTTVVNVEEVTINPENIDLDIGKTAQLTVNVLPVNATNKEYTLVSNNEDVATITSAGLITAHSAGQATITATTEDGGYTATCVVNVSPDPDFEWTATGTPTAGTVMLKMAGIDFVQKMTGHSYVGWSSTKGSQYGAASSTGTVEFVSSLVSLDINDLQKVVVNMSNSASSGSATLKVYVGSTQIGNTIQLTNNAAAYEFIPAQAVSPLRTTTEDIGHLRIVAEGNGICFLNLRVYGADAAIAAANDSDVQFAYEYLLEADTCVDYVDAPDILDLLEALSVEERAMVENALYITNSGTVETLKSKLEYMLALYDSANNESASGANKLSTIISQNSTSLIAVLVIGLLGLTSVGAYYFLNKKRYGNSTK